MFTKEYSFPKASHIVRPSSSLIRQHDYSSSTSSSPSTISTLSSLNNGSNNDVRVQPTIVSPSNFAYFQNSWNIKSTIGVNPNRFLQRPRSDSNLSKSTLLSASSHSDDEEDLNSIDGLTDSEADEEEIPKKVVARVKHGTIMNGRREFINKGNGTYDEQNTRLDEARANRKIADLEIEKASLLILNSTLETKLRQQASQIADLQKQLQMYDGGLLTPVSDKQVDELLLLDNDTSVFQPEEDDKVFQRIKSVLESLIVQAEAALIQKSTQTRKVLNGHAAEGTAKKNISLRRRVSDISAASVKSAAVKTLYRQSSPPVMITTPSPQQRPKWNF
ncbi:MAG: hypothetical protein EXX96DRAFT_568062 [Benjaminiella poitrasii]|nr:MAG: hypothetical protein EXX96DRAFT_568062 [Benjaminiella poitrasii]